MIDELRARRAQLDEEFHEEHSKRLRLEAERLRQDFPELEGVDLGVLEWIVNAAFTLRDPVEDSAEVVTVRRDVPPALSALQVWRIDVANHGIGEPKCEVLNDLDATIAGLKRVLETLPQPTPPLNPAERLVATIDLLLRPQLVLSRATMIDLVQRLRDLAGRPRPKGLSYATISRAVDRRDDPSNPLPPWNIVGWLAKPPR
jgi:hypothetical protein